MTSGQVTTTTLTTRLLTHAASSVVATRRRFCHDEATDMNDPSYHQPSLQGTTAAAVVDDRNAFPGLIPLLHYILSYLLLGSVLIGTSAVTYGIFYFGIMPSPCTRQPLYFDYTGTAPLPNFHPTENIHQEYEQPPVAFHYVAADRTKRRIIAKTFPWAAVDLFATATSWEAHRSEVVPPPRVQQQVPLTRKNRILKADHLYFIELHLQLPESMRNRDAGIFGVAVELYDTNQTRLATSLRSTRLPHESNWVGVIRKLVWLLPMLVGAVDESRSVIVPSFRYFRESIEFPLQHVLVKIVMPSADADPVEVISGDIRIGQELNAFQRLLKEWYYTCYMVCTMLLFTAQSILLVQWHYFRQRQQQIKEQEQLEHDMDVGSILTFSSWEELPGVTRQHDTDEGNNNAGQHIQTEQDIGDGLLDNNQAGQSSSYDDEAERVLPCALDSPTRDCLNPQWDDLSCSSFATAFTSVSLDERNYNDINETEFGQYTTEQNEFGQGNAAEADIGKSKVRSSDDPATTTSDATQEVSVMETGQLTHDQVPSRMDESCCANYDQKRNWSDGHPCRSQPLSPEFHDAEDHATSSYQCERTPKCSANNDTVGSLNERTKPDSQNHDDIRHESKEQADQDVLRHLLNSLINPFILHDNGSVTIRRS